MSDNKDTQDDEIEFSQDELEELKKQGIDDDELDDIVKSVNEALSNNANAKEIYTAYDKMDFTPYHADGTPLMSVYVAINFFEIKRKPKKKSKTDDKDSRGDKAATLSEKQSTESATTPNKTADKPPKISNVADNTKDKGDSTKTSDGENESDDDKQKQADIVRTMLAKKHSEKTVDHKSVRINIEAGALPTKMFFIMNGLSAIIAGYGLLANSPAVVIGAMLVAMMLSPITGAALAAIDARLSLLKTSLMTLFGGVFVIYAVGMVLGLLYPDNVMTSEILSRTAPTTMDLIVALAGGAAGAYAMISPNLSVAVVGVAVATALVPPLTASGILLSAGEARLAMGALILAITNMLAIQFTNALVLWFAGFRRTLDDKDVSKLGQIGLFLKRNSAVLLALVLIGGYLSMNLKQTLNEQNFERQSIALIEENLQNQPNHLMSQNFSQNKDTRTVRLVLEGTTPPTQAQVKQLEQQIQDIANHRFKDGKAISLQVRFIPQIIIESDGVNRHDVKLSSDDIKQRESGIP
ncbi:DUF389 domain-containing protein [Moraxella bovoculi]|uniref:DUF389 domain-containing protein n=1 Tax=Moraxella bovoculi TaxID=386891 RepID=UPI000E58D75C|nr:DUF389 domain-containing protein [Moraxella bovoculi]